MTAGLLTAGLLTAGSLNAASVTAGRTWRHGIWGASLALVLLGCTGNDQPPLEGDREPVRPDAVSTLGVQADAPALSLGKPISNASWVNKNGSNTHAARHVAAEFPLTPVWSVPLGAGNSTKSRITSGPIVVDGIVYAMDALGQVSAISAAGIVLWTVDTSREDEEADDGFGGAVAFGDDTLIATTGFGEAIAIEPEDGSIRWRHELAAPVRSSAVVVDGRAVVIARNGETQALDLDNGRIRWRLEGLNEEAAMLGGAGPAAGSGLVVLPLASGEVVAALARNGRRAWTSAIAGGRRGTVRSRISDITGDPVISGDNIFVANQSWRLVSLDRTSGARDWIVNDGAMGPLLPVADALFFINDLAQLKRLDRASGDALWTVQLAQFGDPDDRRDAVAHFGPLLVGGRLLIASSDGMIRSFDARTGEAMGSALIPKGGAAAQPAIANGQIYIVTTNGALVAFQ